MGESPFRKNLQDPQTVIDHTKDQIEIGEAISEEWPMMDKIIQETVMTRLNGWLEQLNILQRPFNLNPLKRAVRRLRVRFGLPDLSLPVWRAHLFLNRKRGQILLAWLWLNRQIIFRIFFVIFAAWLVRYLYIVYFDAFISWLGQLLG